MGSMGEQIRNGRLARGLTQATLAGLVRVDRCSVSNWERDRTAPKRLHRWMLEQVLGCKLTGGGDNGGKPEKGEPAND